MRFTTHHIDTGQGAGVQVSNLGRGVELFVYERSGQRGFLSMSPATARSLAATLNDAADAEDEAR